MINVFLSASVPLPDRNPQFIATADVISIRESIKALVTEIAPRGQLVFGGHPAITPLIALLLKSAGPQTNQRFVLYQSAYFSGEFSASNDRFVDLRVVAGVRNSRKRSIAAMRKRMISDTRFDAGVFIGGMEGVLEEFELFQRTHPDAQLWPIASTGAAAQQIFEQRPDLPRDLSTELTYSTLFRKLLDGI